MSGLRTVHVPLGDRSYDVLVGSGARHELASMLPTTARRAAIITQPGIPLDVDPGIPCDVFHIGTGEDHKHLGTVESLCRSFARVRRQLPMVVAPSTNLPKQLRPPRNFIGPWAAY